MGKLEPARPWASGIMQNLSRLWFCSSDKGNGGSRYHSTFPFCEESTP